MSEFPLRKITIYHKDQNNWVRHVVEASYRNTSILNHNRSGSNSTDNVLIRIFDIEGYNSLWFVEKGDIIVNREVANSIEGNTPNTQLSSIYGKDNVHKVTSVDKFIFNDSEIEELEHIKIGAI